MSFYDPKDLVIGDAYKLTEIVETLKVSAGNYFLVSIEPKEKDPYPVLIFSKVNKRRSDEVFLVQAHAQFGDPTWRRAFKVGKNWEVYWPAGGRTWNWSLVVVEKI